MGDKEDIKTTTRRLHAQLFDIPELADRADISTLLVRQCMQELMDQSKHKSELKSENSFSCTLNCIIGLLSKMYNKSSTTVSTLVHVSSSVPYHTGINYPTYTSWHCACGIHAHMPCIHSSPNDSHIVHLHN